MIFHLTRAAAEILGISVPETVPTAGDPYLDWQVHRLRMKREPCFMISNTASLYTVVIPGMGLNGAEDFRRRALVHLREYLFADGNGFFFERFMAPHTGTVRFSRAANRRVLSAMNILARDATLYESMTAPSLTELSDSLNETPLSVIGHDIPRDVFRSLAVAGTDKGNPARH